MPKDLINTFEHPEQAIKNFKGKFTIDGPNNLIYKLDGNLEMEKENQLIKEDGVSYSSDYSDKTVPLNNDNVLLRGMSLRNVESILGIVIYTGHETKIQMNTTKSGYKVSKMMGKTNIAIFWIFMLQIFFSTLGATICAYWTIDNMDNPYLDYKNGGIRNYGN